MTLDMHAFNINKTSCTPLRVFFFISNAVHSCVTRVKLLIINSIIFFLSVYSIF